MDICGRPKRTRIIFPILTINHDEELRRSQANLSMAGCPLHVEVETQSARKQLPHDEPHCFIDSSTAFVSEIANLRQKMKRSKVMTLGLKKTLHGKETCSWWFLKVTCAATSCYFPVWGFWICFILCYLCQVKLFAFNYWDFTVHIQSLFHCINATAISLMWGFIQVVDFR